MQWFLPLLIGNTKNQWNKHALNTIWRYKIKEKGWLTKIKDRKGESLIKSMLKFDCKIGILVICQTIRKIKHDKYNFNLICVFD